MIGRYRDGVVPDVDVDPALAADFDGLVPEVCELLDRAEITQALERIWQRVRRLNRYVEERAPWQLAKDEAAGRPSSTSTLRSLAEGIRAVTVLLHPYIPETAAKLLAALGEEDLALESARVRRAPRRRARVGKLRRFPQAAVIDSHTHLDSTPGTDAEIVARAPARPASRRILTIGTDAESSPPRAGGRRGARGGLVRRRPPPEQRDRLHRRDHRRAARARRATRAARAIGETGLDDYRDYAPRADQERAFAAHIGLARELGKPLVIHTRAADDDTIATLAPRRAGARGDPALLLDARPPRRVPRARLVDLASPATSPTRRRASSRSRPSARRSTASSSRPTRRT